MPPRDVASLVILRAITKAAWLVAGVLLVGTAIMVFDVYASGGQAAASVGPVALLIAQLAALALLYLRPRPRTGVIFLIVSLICIAGFQFLLLTTTPPTADIDPFLANRPIVALCAIGAVTGRPIAGILWSTTALVTGETVSALVHLSLGRPLQLGVGPLLAWLLIVTLLLWLYRNARNQSIPEPDPGAGARAAAVIRDTVLGDLAAIVHGRVVLTEGDRQYLRDNLRRLGSTMVEDRADDRSLPVDVELLSVVRDLQWRGLSVEVSGSGSALSQLDRPARSAALAAIRAALDNVLTHAGTTSADVFIDDTAVEVMVMVVDQGAGFEADDASTRGVKASIVERIQSCGGRVTVWSQLGVGTSVVVSLPKEGGIPRAS